MLNPDDEGYWAEKAPRSQEASYEEAHQWLKACQPDESAEWIFGAMRGLEQPLVNMAPKEVLLSVRSFDADGGEQPVIEYLRALSSELNEALPPSHDENGFVGANGVHKPFDSLRTVAGICSTPMSYMPVNNGPYADSFDLPSDFRKTRHKEIFHEFFRLVFGRFAPRPLKVPKLSTAGFPTGTTDPVWKARAGKWLLHNFDQPGRLIASREYGELARQFGMVRCYKQQKRTQVDPPGKKRYANTLEYALSGGLKGEPIEVNKLVNIAGKNYPDFSALRVRVVHGAPWLANIPLQAISTGVLYALFEWAEPTFHHTDMGLIAELIERSGDAVFSDISNYDNSMREFILRELVLVSKEYVSEEVADWAEAMIFAPYFTQPVGYKQEGRRSVATSRAKMIGRPFDPTSEVIAGNRSGHAWTSLIAKTVKVWDTLCVIDDITGDVLGNVERYLKHEMPYKIVNNGDDEGLIGPKDLIQRYRDYRFQPGPKNPGYFVAEPEIGQVFSGFMFMKSPGGSIRAVPRLHTLFEKIYVPERSIGGNFRPYWPIGIEQRLTLDISPNADFSQNPSVGVALDIHSRLWNDMMAKRYGRLAEILVNGKSMMPVQVGTGSFTRIDYEVLEQPEKLHYKYKDSDVSPEVLKLIAGANIQFDEYESFINTHYKGTIL